MVGMKTIVLGTHEYQWVLWPFAALFAKYAGPDRLLYVGDRLDDEALPDNVDFMQVPAYSQGVWDWCKWFSNGFVSILEYFKDELLLVFLMDHWLNRPIDHAGLDRLVQFMADNDNVFRAALRIDCLNTDYAIALTDEIVSVSPFDAHASFHGGVTFCPSIWRPELSIRLFGNGWSLWECETLGTRRAGEFYQTQQAIAAYPGVISYTHGMVHTSDRVNLIGLNDEDRRLIMNSLPERMVC